MECLEPIFQEKGDHFMGVINSNLIRGWGFMVEILEFALIKHPIKHPSITPPKQHFDQHHYTSFPSKYLQMYM